MRFLFDCEDEVCLPRAYFLVDEAKPFIEKLKETDADDVDENASKTNASKTAVFKTILKNIMVKYPKETGELLSKLWILEEIEVPILDKDGNEISTKKEVEKAPNTFKTMATLFSNEVAVDFFLSVLPSLLQISKDILPLLK